MKSCCVSSAWHRFDECCRFSSPGVVKGEEPLAPWERELLTCVSEPVAVAYVHVVGGKVLEFEDVRPDSIGPSAVHPGVIGIEFNSGAVEVAHVPFVEFWHIEYR